MKEHLFGWDPRARGEDRLPANPDPKPAPTPLPPLHTKTQKDRVVSDLPPVPRQGLEPRTY